MTGVFTSSNVGVVDGITEGTFSAYIDISELGFDCSMLAGFVPGLSCSECPSQPGVFQCVVFDIIDIPGVLVPDLSLVPRSEQDIDDDPNCG
jgi:hypothetical protein